jgi:hypothetical protein
VDEARLRQGAGGSSRLGAPPAVASTSGRKSVAASSIATPYNAPVAQLDGVSASEEVKQRFETGGKDWEIRDFKNATYPHIERSDQGVTKSRSAGQKGYCYNLKMRP